MLKYIVGAIAMVVGIVAIVMGLKNINRQTETEMGRRRSVDRVAGVDSNYTGWRAVMQGRIRVLAGIAAIAFGIAFMVVGPSD